MSAGNPHGSQVQVRMGMGKDGYNLQSPATSRGEWGDIEAIIKGGWKLINEREDFVT